MQDKILEALDYMRTEKFLTSTPVKAIPLDRAWRMAKNIATKNKWCQPDAVSLDGEGAVIFRWTRPWGSLVLGVDEKSVTLSNTANKTVKRLKYKRADSHIPTTVRLALQKLRDHDKGTENG